MALKYKKNINNLLEVTYTLVCYEWGYNVLTETKYLKYPQSPHKFEERRFKFTKRYTCYNDLRFRIKNYYKLKEDMLIKS